MWPSRPRSPLPPPRTTARTGGMIFFLVCIFVLAGIPLLLHNQQLHSLHMQEGGEALRSVAAQHDDGQAAPFALPPDPFLLGYIKHGEHGTHGGHVAVRIEARDVAHAEAMLASADAARAKRRADAHAAEAARAARAEAAIAKAAAAKAAQQKAAQDVMAAATATALRQQQAASKRKPAEVHVLNLPPAELSHAIAASSTTIASTASAAAAASTASASSASNRRPWDFAFTDGLAGLDTWGGGDLLTCNPRPVNLQNPKLSARPPVGVAGCESGNAAANAFGPSRGDGYCYHTFGSGYLTWWAKRAKTLCRGDGGGGGPRGELTCRVHTHPLLNPPTGPHTLCDARGLVVDWRKLAPAACVKHRPGWKCGPGAYNHYAPGALSAACATASRRGLDLKQFPKDHLRDIFGSFNRAPATPAAVHEEDTGVTLFVTRERGEHVNIAHTVTDWFAAFQALRVLAVDPARVAVVILDNHVQGRFDPLWGTLFSRRRPLARAAALRRNATAVRYAHAVFSPPGYSSVLLTTPWHETRCHGVVDSLQEFSQFVLDRVGVAWEDSLARAGPVRILFVSRKPYNAKDTKHAFMGRQIVNEDDIVRKLQTDPALKAAASVVRVDFARIPIEDQIRAVAAADVMIGMHGAGLAHALWLPRNGAMVELRVKNDAHWRIFENYAQWGGRGVHVWVNKNKANFRKDKAGDYLTIDWADFRRTVWEVVEGLQAARMRRK